ncbi:MAG TPA: DoxX family protein [Opitutaceae bacterium]|nr:DoxX family protein [Opitutaceae bacterium]
MKQLLQLDFLPRSFDVGVLLLRLGFGGSMAALHGWGKLMNYSAMSGKFADPFGLGPAPSLVLAIIGELVFAVMVAIGLFTRLAALGTAFTMGVAFFIAHEGNLTGANSGEMSFLYLLAFTALFISGGGHYSVDAKIGAKV